MDCKSVFYDEVKELSSEQIKEHVIDQTESDKEFDSLLEYDTSVSKSAYFVYDIHLKSTNIDTREEFENRKDYITSVTYKIPEGFKYFSDFLIRIDLPTLTCKDEFLLKYNDNIASSVIKSFCFIIDDKEYFFNDNKSMLINLMYNKNLGDDKIKTEMLGYEKRNFSKRQNGISFEFLLPCFYSCLDDYPQLCRFTNSNLKIDLKIEYSLNIHSVLTVIKNNKIVDNLESVNEIKNDSDILIPIPKVRCSAKNIHPTHDEYYLKTPSTERLIQNSLKFLCLKKECEVGKEILIKFDIKKEVLAKSIFLIAEQENNTSSFIEPYMYGIRYDSSYFECFYSGRLNYAIDNNSIAKLYTFKENSSPVFSNYQCKPFFPGYSTFPFTVLPFQRNFQSQLTNKMSISVVLGDYKNISIPPKSLSESSSLNWLKKNSSTFTIYVYYLCEENIYL